MRRTISPLLFLAVLLLSFKGIEPHPTTTTTVRSPIYSCDQPIQRIESVKYPGNFLSITKSGKLVVTVNQYGISELMSTWQGYFPNPWFNITYDGQGSVRQAICSGCGQVGDVCLKGSPLELDPRDAQDAYSYWDITMVSGSLLQGWEVYFNLEDRGLLCLEFSGGELQPKLNDKNAFLTRQPDKRNCLFLITTY